MTNMLTENHLLKLCLMPLLLYSGILGAEQQTKAGFDQTFSLQGISFHVFCPNQGSLNQLTITPSGLEISNRVIQREIDGRVTGAEVGDLNADGSPEIYVYISSAGSGSYGNLVAYSANNKKSLSDIYLPPLTDIAENAAGYMGHDEFTLVESRLGRRFPLYNKGDSNAAPSGGMRQLTYRLSAGEASWKLVPDQRMDFAK